MYVRYLHYKCQNHNQPHQPHHHNCHTFTADSTMLPSLLYNRCNCHQPPWNPWMLTTVSEGAGGMKTLRAGVFWHVTRSVNVRWGSSKDVRVAPGFLQISMLKWSAAHVQGRRALPNTLRQC